MPRYVVEREFPDGLQIPIDESGAKACLAVVEGNAVEQVAWLHSYVSADKKRTFCVYDGPSPEAIRRTAGGTMTASIKKPILRALGALTMLCSLAPPLALADEDSPLIDRVHNATARYTNINAAIADGWVTATPCVSGPNTGAMGVHLVLPARIASGVLSPE